jgi:hypothetical protein
MNRPAYRAATPRGDPVKLIMFVREFFFIPQKKIVVESNAGAGRTYFLYRDRIVAVGELEGASR